MTHPLQPRLHPVAIADLRPTQMTVGRREVDRKRRDWRERAAKDGSDYLGRHMLPAVRGPKGRPWIIDHHHLALALHLEGVKQILVSVVADLHHLSKAEFLVYMDNRNWLHPFDAKGRRCDVEDLPTEISALVDDPFRSLAGALREVGGYAKDTTPYSEFLWADHLRRRMKASLPVDDFDRAIAEAKTLAHAAEAAHLPGWVGAGDHSDLAG